MDEPCCMPANYSFYVIICVGSECAYAICAAKFIRKVSAENYNFVVGFILGVASFPAFPPFVIMVKNSNEILFLTTRV